MKHLGLKAGSVSIRGGSQKVNDMPSRRLESKPFVRNTSNNQTPNQPTDHLKMADDLEALIDECYQSVTPFNKSSENDAAKDLAVSTIVNGLKDMFVSSCTDENRTRDQIVNDEQFRTSFLALEYVIKILVYRRELARYRESMLKANCGFAFKAFGKDGSAEELSFMTVLDYIVEKFMQKET